MLQLALSLSLRFPFASAAELFFLSLDFVGLLPLTVFAFSLSHSHLEVSRFCHPIFLLLVGCLCSSPAESLGLVFNDKQTSSLRAFYIYEISELPEKKNIVLSAQERKVFRRKFSGALSWN